MSNYWRLHCLTCDEDMGGDRDTMALNHGEKALVLVIKHRDTIIAAYELYQLEEEWWIEVSISIRGAFMEIDWLMEHREHDLVVRDEYDQEYLRPDGRRFRRERNETEWRLKPPEEK